MNESQEVGKPSSENITEYPTNDVPIFRTEPLEKLSEDCIGVGDEKYHFLVCDCGQPPF